ncbi:hypothetical protein Patl1_18207 [Pistacia atlantica]|uniref:Uncharacterized protein n=1 Tax=Pistacia atlantica TaxID=434234 RepID=A0ACC1C379_9ROSI|nr:hypothetical protein Patl1_18207 [Pistacia atlantica]
MTTITIPKLPLLLKPFFLSLFFSLFFLLFLAFSQTPHHRKTYPSINSNTTLQKLLPRSSIWTTRDWDRKVRVFANFFQSLKQRNLLSNDSKALSIGARVGQEVAALKQVGVYDAVGIDLVPYPPLVVKGDFHAQPFENGTFDFEFSNVFDHALYPWKFVGEIERTLKAGGICVLHVAISRRADKYSANDLYSLKPLIELFKRSELVDAKKDVDGFGLDTEMKPERRRLVSFSFIKLADSLF